MPLNIRSITNSRTAIGAALALGQALPEQPGYWIARFIADRIAASKQSELVRAIRTNQWVVSGCSLDSRQLDLAVRETLRHIATGYFDFYHNVNRLDRLNQKVRIADNVRELVQRTQRDGQAAVYACPHISNIDAAGRVLAWNGLKAQLLSVPQPPGGYQSQNDLRRQSGLDITPISIESLRQASQRLKAGGSVLTGLDRPVPDIKYRLNFFGHPAPLPVIHVRLAIKARCPVIVVACIGRPEGGYEIIGSEPIEMQPHPDLETEVLQNAQAVLNVAETYIRAHARQWAMFYPVWSDLLEETP